MPADDIPFMAARVLLYFFSFSRDNIKSYVGAHCGFVEPARKGPQTQGTQYAV